MLVTVADLSQRRAQTFDQVEAILAAPAGTGDELTPEQETNLRSLRDTIGRLDTRIEHQQFADARDRTARGTPVAGGPDTRPELRVFAQVASHAPDGFDGAMLVGQDGSHIPVLEQRHRLADFAPAAEQRSAPALSLGRFLRGLVYGGQTADERRALAEGAIGSGGALVPERLAAEVIDLLRAKSVAFRAGARTVPMDSMTLKFARVTALPTGGWRIEAAPIVEGEPAFGQATLSAKSWALLVKISRELVEDGTNTDAILRQVFASAAALALDRAILYGSGVGPEPLGIANTPGIATISMGGANGAPFAGWAKVLDAIAALETANAGVVTAIVAAPRTGRAIYGLADTSNQPMTLPPRLANIPLLTTTSASIVETQGTNNASSSIILGDFSEVFVGIRTALTISVLNERYADTGQIGFVCWLRADVLVARPAAMARITGITG